MALVLGVAAAGTLELVTGRSAGEPPAATMDEIPVRGIAHAPTESGCLLWRPSPDR